ncbi:hypothetical protein [Flavobacterium sp.]|jgi:hypothetical protein|uniref:hypothetical protein n=1 Tax=Flavobacterium sp. TaxID=239 RepID=UPI0037BF7192
MKAETAYQVILALPESEVSRLYQLLGVHSANVVNKTKSKKKEIISDAEATEYILRKLRRF